MGLRARHLLDRTFTLLAGASVVFLSVILLLVLGPMIWKGSSAVLFYGTTEFRKMQHDLFERGDVQALAAEKKETNPARAQVYQTIDDFKASIQINIEALEQEAKNSYRALGNELRAKGITGQAFSRIRHQARQLRNEFEDALTLQDNKAAQAQMDAILAHEQDPNFQGTSFERLFALARNYQHSIADIDLSRNHTYLENLAQVEDIVRDLLGPRPNETVHPLIRLRYGATRWDQARTLLHKLNWVVKWEKPASSDPNQTGVALVPHEYPRKAQFTDTALEPLFGLVNDNIHAMLKPRLTVYWQYFIDDSYNSHYFGGVGPEILGTLIITLLSIIFVIPFGVIAAAYLVECAGDNWIVRIIRMCINTLAGVPSIVFGLFGVAFFIMFLLPVLGLESKACILAASLTLAVLTLPVMIRASEEAIRSVPQSYKEGSLALGASGFRTFVTVTLPAALPGILTGIILSLSRVAGETAPVLFTGAVSMGSVPNSLLDPTRTLSYGSYDMAVGDRVAMMVPHKQYGMVVTLVGLILILNTLAIILRARVFKKLKGH